MKKRLVVGLLSLGLAFGAVGAVSASRGVEVKEVGATAPTTFRLWLNRNGHYQDGYQWQISYTDSTENVIPGGYPQVTSSLWLAYFDVPVEAIGKELTFTPYTDGAAVENVSITIDYVSGDNAQVYYINYDESATTTWYMSQGIAAQNFDSNNVATTGVFASVLATVLGAYDSCDADKDYGYGNYEQLAQTWIRSESDTWYTYGNMGEYTVTEPNGNNTYDAYTKHVQMLANYNNMSTASNSIFVQAGDDHLSSGLIVGGVAIAAIGSVAVLVTIRKRKGERA